MNSVSTWAIAVVLGIAAPFTAHALETDSCRVATSDETFSGTRFLLLDLSPAGEERAAANRIFSFSGTDADPAVQELRDALVHMGNCPPDSNDIARAARPVIALLRRNGDHLAQRSSIRWISGKGDNIRIYVLRSPGRRAKVEIGEDPRQTRLSSDLVTLTKLAQKISRTDVMEEVIIVEPDYSFTFREYSLTKTRATVKVVGSLLPDTANLGKADDEDAPSKLNTSLITGPPEHFFLSANVAYTKVRQIKYDEATRSLQPNAKPKEFFIGVDYTIGDLFDDASRSSIRSFLDGVYMGLMLEGSTQPFNQLALTLGFRHNLPGLEKFVTFEAVSPYLGVVWARNDRLVGSGVSSSVDSNYGKGRFVFGLSLNLDKALGWAGGG